MDLFHVKELVMSGIIKGLGLGPKVNKFRFYGVGSGMACLFEIGMLLLWVSLVVIVKMSLCIG